MSTQQSQIPALAHLDVFAITVLFVPVDADLLDCANNYADASGDGIAYLDVQQTLEALQHHNLEVPHTLQIILREAQTSGYQTIALIN